MRGTKTRLATGLVLVPVMLVFLAMAGTSAFGKPKSSAAQYKVTICHHTSSAKNPMVTISVSSKAATKHVNRHGDTLGPCQLVATTQAASTEANGNGNGQGKGKGKSK